MITVTPGKVLSPLKGDALVSEPHLILAANQLSNAVIAIPITVRRCTGRCYYSGYRTLEYEKVQGALDLENPSLAQLPDLTAPGIEIVSTAANGGYAFASGSSLAAAHASGALALLTSASGGDVARARLALVGGA